MASVGEAWTLPRVGITGGPHVRGFRRDPVPASGEKHGSGAEFSAAARQSADGEHTEGIRSRVRKSELEQEVLRDFPDLTADDIRACLAFAADRERRLVAGLK
jgi:hypothetical protein